MRISRSLVFVGMFAVGCSGESTASPPWANPSGAGPTGPGAGKPATKVAPRALPATALRVQKAEIRDERGFDRPMVAATVLIPVGWKAEGGIVWGPYGQCGNDYAANWQASAPDGVSGFAMVAMPNWTGTRSAYPTPAGPCGQAFHLSVREYLEATAQRLHPGARVLEFKLLPEEAKPYQDTFAQFPMMQTQGMRTDMVVEVGELLVSYSDQGRTMHEALSSLVFITRAQMADVMNPGQVGIDSVSGFPVNFTIARAPEGKLDRGLRKRILSSMRTTPQWSKATAEFNARKTQAFSNSMAAGHAARMAAIKKTGEIINGNYEDRTLTNDRMHRESIEAIRGVETYTDTDGRPVQLDSTYDHAWRANDDTYILTNDPSFRPGQYGIEAKQLQVAK